MDLKKLIEELYAEKARVERAIAALEEIRKPEPGLPEAPVTRQRRGRKSMGSKERQDVSVRMRKYWASRRVNPTAELPTGTSPT